MSPPRSGPLAGLLRVVAFAAEAHRGQHRKDAGRTPYVQHPIAVAELLARVGGVDDLEVLQAALLHDTLEDTSVSAEELENRFGPRVRALVEAVSDDKGLAKSERKQRRVAGAAALPDDAKRIVLADKAANVADLDHDRPVGWPAERKLAYVQWAERVVAGCRGSCPALERHFDGVAAAARVRLRPGGYPTR